MRRLTARQKAFVDAYLAGSTPSKAYRSSYSTEGMSAATIATEAQRLLNHPRIAPIITEAKNSAIKRASWSREVAIERVRKVNDLAFEGISGGDMSRDNQRAFFESESRLSELCDIPFEQRLRREAIEHELNGMSIGVNLHPSWRQTREVIDNAEATDNEDD